MTAQGRKSRVSTLIGNQDEDHDTHDMAARNPHAPKVTATSSYIHYEFKVPHDERPSKHDMVIHHNSGKIFTDGEMKTAQWEKLSEDVLCGFVNIFNLHHVLSDTFILGMYFFSDTL